MDEYKVQRPTHQIVDSRKPEVIPNYYGYKLKVNDRKLTAIQTKYFMECVNKIHRENFKVIYRGEKKTNLLKLYNTNQDNFPKSFNNTVFITGSKARMFASPEFPRDRMIDIAVASRNEFALIFAMLNNLLNKEFPFSARRSAMTRFRIREDSFTTFFRNTDNQHAFIDKMNNFSPGDKIILRDYYLALLHHIDGSEYYTSSFLLSTTSSFKQAHNFAWKNEKELSTNPLIIFGWVPKGFEGILSAPNTRILQQNVKVVEHAIPLYSTTFFPKQVEITLKGGLLPHYFLGYLHNTRDGEVFEINPALFQTNNTWNGIELPVDQSTFYERIRHTNFALYFSVDEDRFMQHRR